MSSDPNVTRADMFKLNEISGQNKNQRAKKIETTS